MIKAWNRFRLHPLAAIVCIFAGAIFGKLFPRAGVAIGPVGDLFLSLFKMCALPIVITIIVESFYRLMARSDRMGFIARAFRIFGVGACLSVAAGLAASACLSPFTAGNSALMAFLSSQMAAQPHLPASPPTTATEFLLHFIPQNVFHALAEGQILSCLIFFALFGGALARVPTLRKVDVYEAIRAIKDALFLMLGWFIQFLPVAVFAIFAKMFAGMTGEGASSIGRLALICTVPCFFLFVFQLGSLALLRRSKLPGALEALRGSLLIAFSSGSSIIALPSAMQSLVESGKAEDWAVETIMPLSVSFNPQATVLYNAFMVAFCAQVSGLALSGKLLVLIGLGSIVQGICSSGMPAIATLGTLAMIFGPLGLPIDLVVVLVLTITPFLSPLLSVANLFGHAWAVLLIERREQPALRDATAA